MKNGEHQLFSHNEALLRIVLVYGVPVLTAACALGVSKQTVYRRMQQARICLRQRAKETEEPRP